MRKRHCICLSLDQRAELTALTRTGVAPARAQTRARILLKADQGAEGPGWTDARIAEAVETSMRTVARVRRTWVGDGATAAIQRKRPAVRTPRKLDGANDVLTVRATRYYRWTEIYCMIPDPAGAAVTMIARNNHIAAH